MQWACATQAVSTVTEIQHFLSLSKPLTEMSFNVQMCWPVICDVNQQKEKKNKGLHETPTDSQHHRLGIQHLSRSAVTWQEQISTSLTVTNDSKRLYSSQRPFWAPDASVNLCWWAHFPFWLTSIHEQRERDRKDVCEGRDRQIQSETLLPPRRLDLLPTSDNWPHH